MTPKGKRPVVLVVEDEPLALMLAMDIIDDMGFMAVPAPNADQALAIMESRGDVRVVFTDINMPGSMDGIGLAHVVRRRWPPVRILVASGRPLAEPSPLPSGAAFLQKPYSLRAVEVSLAEMLG